jgi:FkbM family methyltransferase
MGQAGQDLWVIGEVFNEKRDGFFVDIGAHDGVELSNTYVLEKRYGWQGICVEANPESFELLKANRAATCIHACLDQCEGSVEFAKRGMHGSILGVGDEEGPSETVVVQSKTLNRVLQEQNAPLEIDYLSVDVEGAEDRVFAGLDLNSVDVTCMTVERPSAHLRRKLAAAGYMVIKEIPGLDTFYLHEKHQDQYLQNVFSFYKKRHLAWRWK